MVDQCPGLEAGKSTCAHISCQDCWVFYDQETEITVRTDKITLHDKDLKRLFTSNHFTAYSLKAEKTIHKTEKS